MFFLSNIKIDNNAKIIETDDFINVTFSENTVLNHFWKIHISMKFEDSEAVITTVANYLNKKHINYKFVKSTGLVKEWLSIRTHESQIGKIITIYPTSIAQADLLLKQLSKILRNYNGPNIFTDRAYKDSQNVFYRYGYHIATSDDHIIGPNQEIFYDDRRPYFQIPSWIKDPFCSENNVNGQAVQNKYKVIGAIDRRPGGNVYLASSYRDGKKYIIKEARKYVFAGDNKLKSVLKHNEFNTIKDLNKKKFNIKTKSIEKIVDNFSEYYVYSFENLKPLDSQSQFSPLLAKPQKKAQALLEIINMSLSLVNKTKQLHDLGYCDLDATLSNLSWDGSQITWLDCESFSKKSNDGYAKTKGYWLDEFAKINNYQRDIKHIGLFIMHILGDFNYTFQKLKTIDQVIVQIEQHLIQSKLPLDIIKVITYILDSDDLQFNTIEKLLNSAKKSLINKDYQKTRQFILTEINKNVLSEKKSNVIGIMGIMKPYFINNNYVSGKKEDIIEILNNYEVKNGEKTFLKQNPNPNSVISPYLIDGAAGAILVSLLNSVEIKDIKQYLEILNYPLAKTPGFLDGLAGIAFVNIELFLHTHNNKYLQIATTQVLNCMNYTIIENSSVLFYSFYSTHNSENFFNGTEGIYAMAQYLYEINESRLAKNDKKILA